MNKYEQHRCGSVTSLKIYIYFQER